MTSRADKESQQHKLVDFGASGPRDSAEYPEASLSGLTML